MAQAAAGQLIAEGPEKQVGIGGGHDLGRMAATLVLLHGFTHTGASWNRVLTELGAERYRPLAPDIRGHGVAADTEPVELEHVIDDVAGLAKGRFTLAGYSMGGRIALHVALALGSRVERLVLIGASPGLDDPSERAARRAADERLADRIEAMEIGEFAREWAQTPVLAGLPDDVRREVEADRSRNTVAGLARALRGLGTGALPSLWDRLGDVTAPVTLAVGERDEKFQDVADRMRPLLPSADTVVVRGAGHAVHLEAPAQTARLISGG